MISRAAVSFWKIYPKKEAKELARAAWHTLWRQGGLPSLAVLEKAIRVFASGSGWQRENGRFIPHAANWLRGRRWLDEGVSYASIGAPSAEAQAVKRRLEAEDAQRQAAHAEKYAAVRPIFEDFLTAFPAVGNTAPLWGLWVYLHDKGSTLRKADVPAALAAQGPLAFLQAAQRQCGQGACAA